MECELSSQPASHMVSQAILRVVCLGVASCSIILMENWVNLNFSSGRKIHPSFESHNIIDQSKK